MQVNNNLNSMIQLSNKLEKSANELAKLNNSNQQALNNKEQQDTKQTDLTQDQEQDNPDIAKEMVQQIEIPIAYTANATVISTQDATTKTLLDIKA